MAAEKVVLPSPPFPPNMMYLRSGYCVKMLEIEMAHLLFYVVAGDYLYQLLALRLQVPATYASASVRSLSRSILRFQVDI